MPKGQVPHRLPQQLRGRHRRVELGSFTSRDFVIVLRNSCGSFAQICGGCHFSSQDEQHTLKRFAGTTNPRKKLREIYCFKLHVCSFLLVFFVFYLFLFIFWSIIGVVESPYELHCSRLASRVAQLFRVQYPRWNPFPWLYWITYTLFIGMVIMNVVIAVILQGYDESRIHRWNRNTPTPTREIW